jgi:hypothetical protein
MMPSRWVALALVLFGAAITEAGAVAAPVVVLRNNFWVNLHHFVRAESRRRGHHLELELPLASLAGDDRASWERALDAYADLADRNLVFDEALVRIDDALATTPETAAVAPATVDPPIAAALNGAAAAYRDHRWDRDRLANAGWIAAHAAAIMRYTPVMRPRIANVFRVTAPADPILVDVVRDIGPNLAYTTRGPQGFSGHTCISPVTNADPDIAVDTILHEISHTMDAQITAVVNAEAARQHARIPPDLWHALTLYTTYQLAMHAAGRQRDDASYAPHNQFATMFDSNGWRAMRVDFDEFWAPYLEGHAKFKDALTGVVRNAPKQ